MLGVHSDGLDAALDNLLLLLWLRLDLLLSSGTSTGLSSGGIVLREERLLLTRQPDTDQAYL